MANNFFAIAPTQAGRVGQPTRLARRPGYNRLRFLFSLTSVLLALLPELAMAQTDPCAFVPQTIVLSGAQLPANALGNYTPAGTHNGAPQWTSPGTPGQGELFTIRWTGSLWEGIYNKFGQFMTNNTGSISNLPCTGWSSSLFGTPTLSGGCGSLVNPDAPSVSITPTLQTVTSGGSVTLTASGATSYTWSNGSMQNPLMLTNVTSSSTLSVTGTTDQCSATASAAVKVSATICVSGACAAVNGTYVEVTPTSLTAIPEITINRSLFNASAGTYMVHSTYDNQGTEESAWLIFPADEDFPLYINEGDVADVQVIPLTDWLGAADCEEMAITVKLGACISCTSLPDVTIAFPTSATVNPAGPVVTVPVGKGLTFQVFGGGSNARYERRIVLDRPNFFEIRAVTENRDGIFPIDRAGPYSIIVTDGNGCSRTVTGEIRGK